MYVSVYVYLCMYIYTHHTAAWKLPSCVKEGMSNAIELGIQRRQRCFDQASRFGHRRAAESPGPLQALERENALLESIEAANRTAEERLQAMASDHVMHESRRP